MQAMSLIIKGLTPGLTEVGKIKIGEKGRMINSQGGKQFQPPVKLDHFRVATLQRGPDGNYLPDLKVHELYGEKPRKIPVRLLYDDIELNFQCRYTCFLGKTLWCYGDGERAERIINMQAGDGKRHSVACPCGRQEPTYDKQDKCKINSCLSVIIDGVETVGGVWKLRTTSYNSTVGILSSLSLIKRLTGGPLAGLPLNLTLNPKTAIVPNTGQISQVWVVGIEFAGRVEKLQEIAYQQAQRQAIYSVKIEQIETEARRLIAASSMVDVESEASEIVEEFFPEQIEVAARGEAHEPQQQKEAVQEAKQGGPDQGQDAPRATAPSAPATNGTPAADDAGPEKGGILPGAKRRSRRNKFPIVNPQDWNGLSELTTCGATPGQILQIREISATGDPAKDMIRNYLEQMVGYTQLSYMTEDEANDLLGKLAPFAQSFPAPTDQAASPAAEPDRTVSCPMNGETVSVQGRCLSGCETRAQDGFCPLIDDMDDGEVI
jgi:hypothetical protein